MYTYIYIEINNCHPLILSIVRDQNRTELAAKDNAHTGDLFKGTYPQIMKLQYPKKHMLML